ncbi:hypothetical protein GPECTOR_26g500 [Gonium pectorale]|uniref:Protein kinase domain-containing protein n=1 Tax=Gonium pectorale TaxID=33097 RepID=A0A150GFG7_GONPE|nr:hypothetical protein GPECTOR_26g500 [Gonium pectorale]|eukprot:KXZ48597.1 hypothetical protein GPECTOR_26g500 [Gonium pectorale]
MPGRGAQLLSALQALQPGHARVLLTLAANISLPASPTPQRAAPEPGDDDAVPLAIIYRNVTLAGAVRGATELDTRLRRNAFGLQAGWELLQSGGAQLPPPAAAAAATPAPAPTAGVGATTNAPVWKGRPVLVVADMAVVRAAPGPLASWPLGLLGLFHYYAGLNRSGGAGLQLVGLRSRQVYTLQDIGYVGYWNQRLQSITTPERDSATWLLSYLSGYSYVPDVMGGSSAWSWSGDYGMAYNGSGSPVPVLTPPARFEYDLWSPSPSGLLVAAGENGSVAASPPLPPSSFAVAPNASRLLALLQNGAVLSYNVTLAGPSIGEPVQLDTAGLPLAQPAPVETAAAAAALSSASNSVVVIQLQRLTLRGGTSPPVLLSAWADVAAASAGLAGTTELQGWRDSCLDRYTGAAPGGTSGVGGSGGLNGSVAAGAGAGASRQLLWEVKSCRLTLEAESLRVLRYFNAPETCPPAAAAAVASTPGAGQAAAGAGTTICAVLRAQMPASLERLLAQTLSVKGKADFDPVNTSSGSSEASGTGAIAFGFATLGSFTLANSTALAADADEASADDGFSMSFALAQDQASTQTPIHGRTMADQTKLGGTLLAGAFGAGVFGNAQTPPWGVLPPAPTVAGGQATAAQAHGSQPLLPPAMLLATASSNPSSNSLRSAVAEEIEAMMRKCQALAIDSPSSSQAKVRRLQLLGCGAYGAVYLGDWRGMPAAIKFLLLGPDATPTRRERLVREVALTMTLQHAHVVPTYNFEIGAVKVGSVQAGNRLTAVEQGLCAEATDDADVTALQLKLPLCLMAALDIVSGLEYLHGRSVIHGDLTDNNVLLKASQPALPTAAQTGSSQATRYRPCSDGLPKRPHSPPASAFVSAPGGAGATATPPPAPRAGPALPLPEAETAGMACANARPGPTARPPAAPIDGASDSAGVGRGDTPLNSGPAPELADSASGDGGGGLGSGGLAGSQPPGSQLTRGSLEPLAVRLGDGRDAGPELSPQKDEGKRKQPKGLVEEAARGAAAQMLRFVYKIADFGLSVQLQGGSETHLSNMAQGTPFFAAPEVVQQGHLSPAADIYSFGVLLWLLLHGTSLGQIRHLLPRTAHVPVAPLLIRHTCHSLPACARALLTSSLALEPERRPRAEALRRALQEALQDVAGPELSQLLLLAERREHALIDSS